MRNGVEESVAEVLLLLGVHWQQGKTDVELLASLVVGLGVAVSISQERVDPRAIGCHVLYDHRHVRRVGDEQSIPQGTGLDRAIAFVTAPANQGQEGCQNQSPREVIAA